MVLLQAVYTLDGVDPSLPLDLDWNATASSPRFKYDVGYADDDMTSLSVRRYS